MATFTIKRGDTSPALRYALIPATVDLTDATVVFTMSGAGGMILDRAPAQVVTPVPPVVQYVWQPGDTDRAGLFDGEFEVTYPGGAVETFPNNGFVTVQIGLDAEQPRPAMSSLATGGTVTWRRGERRTEFVAAESDDGGPVDLTDATATISISTATACIVLPLTLATDGTGFVWRMTPDTIPDLPPRAYPATLTITRGDQDDLADLVFNIEGGC